MKKGVTLIEVLVVVVLLTIIAIIAFPNYIKVKEHALGKEAIANLKLIAAAEKIYRLKTTFYYPSSGATTLASDMNDFLKLSLVESNWDYSISNASQNTFTINADRAATGCQYSFTQADTEPNPNASCP